MIDTYGLAAKNPWLCFWIYPVGKVELRVAYDAYLQFPTRIKVEMLESFTLNSGCCLTNISKVIKINGDTFSVEFINKKSTLTRVVNWLNAN